ncbi:multicopper oxidase family protein [Phaeobacter sp. B1627]|uniref:multicopper oxidase family protein n=1 Tax=Phaeobacter sp. B1627 TaxID=2583809 RepID=UPI002104C2E3|nr:multicopper oxidase domain-containing protein [Phaeobacter sp. B1627]
MRSSRRRFLAGFAALSAVPAMARPARASQARQFMLEPARQQIAPDGYPETNLWCVNGSMPGETLRLIQGDRLRVEVENRLPQPTSLHWHGIRIDNAMDGVPGVTQAPIQPGARFTYDFALPDAGTYWYHSHAQSVEQVERGLQGALIIAEAVSPDIDQDLPLVIDDMRVTAEAQVDEAFAAPHDLSHAGRLGNVLLVNGRLQSEHSVRRGDRLRLRLINTANARIFILGLQGLEGWVMAYDGMPLRTPRAISDRLTLAPAQRVDLFVDVTASEGEDAFLLQFEQDGGYEMARFTVTSGTAVRRDPPAPLAPNPQFPIDLPSARHVDLRMQGGAMAWLTSAQFKGEELEGRELAQRGQFWAFNGTAGRPVDPLITAKLGETIRIRMFNETLFPHAMHLHGMHFSEVHSDGSLGPLRDTLLMRRGETREIAFQAHNPGDWLLHCHMLSHHAAGMGTWVRVLT